MVAYPDLDRPHPSLEFQLSNLRPVGSDAFESTLNPRNRSADRCEFRLAISATIATIVAAAAPNQISRRIWAFNSIHFASNSSGGVAVILTSTECSFKLFACELRAVRRRQSELELPAGKKRTVVLCPHAATKIPPPRTAGRRAVAPWPETPPHPDILTQTLRPFTRFRPQTTKKPRHFDCSALFRFVPPKKLFSPSQKR